MLFSCVAFSSEIMINTLAWRHQGVQRRTCLYPRQAAFQYLERSSLCRHKSDLPPLPLQALKLKSVLAHWVCRRRGDIGFDRPCWPFCGGVTWGEMFVLRGVRCLLFRETKRKPLSHFGRGPTLVKGAHPHKIKCNFFLQHDEPIFGGV